MEANSYPFSGGYFCFIGNFVTYKANHSVGNALRRNGAVSQKRPAAGVESRKRDSLLFIGNFVAYKSNHSVGNALRRNGAMSQKHTFIIVSVSVHIDKF